MTRRPQPKMLRGALIALCALAAFALGALAVNAAIDGGVAAKKKRGKAQPSFLIRTEVPGQLAPGRTIPLKISLANKRPVRLWVTKLSLAIAVDPAHRAAGCDVTQNYRVTQIPKKFFPYKLAKGKKAKKGKKAPKPKWRTLPAKRRDGNPTLSMTALADVNQDACKGATLTISYKSRATTKKPRKKAASK